jgi:hypothetical protein
MVEILEYCELNHSDEREFYYITNLNSLFPNGYNLKNGGSVFIHTDESKKKYPTD